MTKKKTLLIDGQLFQSPAWDRGMGRYSRSLLRAAWRLFNYDTIQVIYNDNIPLPENVQKEIEEALPGVEACWLTLKTLKDGNVNRVYDANKACLNTFIEDNYADKAVDFLELALFQAEYYPVFPEKTRNFLIFYDLIPYQYPNVYHPGDDYLSRFRSLFEVDHYFAISSTVEKDLIKYLHIPPEMVTNIEGGPTFRETVSEDKKKQIEPPFAVPEKYILAPSGNDYRKNNYRAIQAFEKFRAQNKNDWKLIITSYFDKNELDRLIQLSPNVIFTGSVNEETLEYLYAHAEMLLFASEYEGLGLPILESVAYGNKIVCSSIEAFQEISNDAFYFFDPLDIDAMVGAMTKALNDEKMEWRRKKSFYGAIQKKYTWEHSAQELIKGLSSTKKKIVVDKKDYIAIVVPRLADRFAVATVVNTLHAQLREKYHIDYYFDETKSEDISIRRPSYLEYWSCFHIEDFDKKRYDSYAAVLYHVDNTDLNPYVITKALSLPGITFLYDTSLLSAFTNLEERQIISPERIALEAKITNALSLESLPSLGSLIDASTAVIDVCNHSTPRSLPPFIKEKLHHSSVALHVDNSVIPKSVSKRVVLYWDDSIDDQSAIYDFLQIFSQSSLYDEIKLLVICAETLPSEGFLGLGEKYPNISIVSVGTEFELDRYLRNTDIVLNVYNKASADYLTLLGKALAQGCFLYSIKLNQLPKLAQLKQAGNIDELLRLLESYYDAPSLIEAALPRNDVNGIIQIIEKYRGGER